MRCTIAAAFIVTLGACKPPAADDYVSRTQIAPRAAPAEPIESPDTDGAIWASAEESDKVLYGQPGGRPLFALECRAAQLVPEVRYTRYARADPRAKAILALIGNGHVERFKIDATRIAEVWLWQGAVPAIAPQLDVLTGTREVEATVPGAGSLMLNPGPLPRELIDRCRALAAKSEPALPAPEANPA